MTNFQYDHPPKHEGTRAVYEIYCFQDFRLSGRQTSFKWVHCQGLNVSSNKVSALQGMGDEFLEGYISIVDGEKDPAISCLPSQLIESYA